MELQNLPISPGLVLAAALYSGMSAFVTGPELTARVIERSNWSEVCAAGLRRDLEATRAPTELIPDVPDVRGIMRSILPDLAPLFDAMPDPMAPAREAARRAREAENTRIARAAEGIADQCQCAIAVYTEAERLSIALWAASARAVTPQAIEHRDSGLVRALRSPACQAAGGF